VQNSEQQKKFKDEFMLKKASVIIVLGTLVSLMYVHQQVNLVKLSYLIKDNEKRVEMLVDQNEFLKYNVASLKSPEVLEEVMLARDIELFHPEDCQFVKIDLYKNRKVRRKRKTKNLAKMMFSYVFALKRTAVAQDSR